MKKIKILLIVLLLFQSILIANAAKKYNYVCDNEICYNTTRDFIDTNYYLYPVFTGAVSPDFTTDVDYKLDDYSVYYDDTEFKIEDFCPEPCDDAGEAYDKRFTMLDIITYWSWFSVTDWGFWSPEVIATYDNGLDYLFTFFTDIIDTLHDNAGYGWYPKDQLTDIISNILSYSWSTKEFDLRNVCNYNVVSENDDICDSSIEDTISYWDYINYLYLSWTVSQSDQFGENTFIVSPDYSIVDPDDTSSTVTLTKAWHTVIFSFWYEDYLDFTEDSTTYEYTMFSMLDGETVPTLTGSELEEYIIDNHWFYLNESITIDNDTYEVTSSWLLDEVDNVIDINVLDSDTKHIRVWIEESINLSRAWDTVFYLTAKNITSGELFDVTDINSDLPLTVLPRDEIAEVDSLLLSPFDPDQNANPDPVNWWFWKEIPFPVSLFLKDSTSDFFNVKTDNIDWYKISLSSWTSEYLEMTTDSNADTAIRTKSLTGIKSDVNWFVNFYIRITEPWYHDLKWFNIENIFKYDNTTYLDPTQTWSILWVIPSNLYYSWTLSKIFIKEPIVTDLILTCWNTVTATYTCTWDNYSWCYSSDDIQTYTSESQNWDSVYFEVRDMAYNRKSYSWTLDHVDTTAPEITSIKKDTQDLFDWWSYNYLANSDDVILNLYEKTTNSCIANSYFYITLDWPTGLSKINDKVLYNWSTIDTSISWNTTNYNGQIYYKVWWSNIQLVIPELYTTKWDYTLNIALVDQYWNESNFSMTYTINPNMDLEWNSQITLNWTSWTQYWNNNDYYSYTLSLIDSENNAVDNKEILFLNNDCSSEDTCNQLKTKINFWNDPLIEYNQLWYTDADWKKIFNIKSLVPGNFNWLYKIKLNKWDEEYNDTTEITEYNIWNFSHINSFKIPVKWSLSIVAWWDVPELWKVQQYKIDLVKDENNNLDTISNWSLFLNENTIKDLTDWHFWNKFDLLWDTFDDYTFSSYLGFSWSIDADDNILSAINISTTNLPILYTIWWEEVKYYLSDFWTGWCDVKTLWVKLIWTLQWDGKSDITWQESNVSDLTKWELRSQIRKNSYSLIRNRTSWDGNINNIVFYEWDVSYSSVKALLQPNDTLIIKDWNFIIDEDINTTIWVIILKSNYLIEHDYKNMWNIYVNDNVEYINALIYADWAFRSATADWLSYNDTSLNKQLIFNWSLFTRNTIGWAVKANTQYVLPWWQETDNYDLAEIYDLNYIRKVDNTCDIENDYSFLIKYNPNTQLNPPKWFQ